MQHRKINEIEINNEIFENIKHIDEYGNEYWYARELQNALEYKEWRKFEGVIKKAEESCKNSNNIVEDNFVGSDKIVKTGVATKTINDYKLSRYACYLIAQNGDSRKKVIALAQTYFAYQTRKMELTELEYSKMSEDDKRLYQRNLTRKGNYSLNQNANKTHYKVGKKIRNTIKELDGTMPECLPTPSKSIKELEKDKNLLINKRG